MGIINVYYEIVREKASIERSFSIIDFGRYVKFIPFWFKKMEDLRQSYEFKLLANFSNEFDENYFNEDKNILNNAK